jgi:type IV secretory pathway protease TraF
MRGSQAISITTVGAAVVLMITLAIKPMPLFIWNSSQSVPIGLYAVRSKDPLVVADLVVVMPPEPLAGFLASAVICRKGFLSSNASLHSRDRPSVGMTSPSRSTELINIGTARERDHRDRQLPAWAGCRLIHDGEVFLLNKDEPASLDGRYFGPIPSAAIVQLLDEPRQSGPSNSGDLAPSMQFRRSRVDARSAFSCWQVFASPIEAHACRRAPPTDAQKLGYDKVSSCFRRAWACPDIPDFQTSSQAKAKTSASGLLLLSRRVVHRERKSPVRIELG